VGTLTTTAAARRAEELTRRILHDQPFVRDLVVDSPPGAGKTGVVERLAVQAAWGSDQRVMIATQTNQQAFDIARRLAVNWRPEVYLFHREGLVLPTYVDELENLRPVSSVKDFPETPCVVVANSRKWSFARIEDGWFDLLIVEEAYQLRDAEFAQLAGFAAQRVLVGDPGQIDPVTSCDTTRWSTMPDGPQVPAPEALLRRRPGQTHRLQLPVSRRLPHDTVEIVQPAFYPELPFEATSAPADRRLMPGPGSGHRFDGLIDRAAAGATLTLGELPDRVTGEFDTEMAQAIVDLIERLLERGTRVRDREFLPEDEREMALEPKEIGVTCGHRSQVYAIQERLGALEERTGLDLSEILVETSDRFQGLERQVMVVHHPLAGRLTAQDFHLDAGRLCVMLSRHRVACFVLGRGGMEARLARQAPAVSRVLSHVPDAAFSGARRHRELLALLRAQDRVVGIDG
jgi:hypothetical protein